jgi:CubicO group peptidase (beta-lactamase class C family)
MPVLDEVAIDTHAAGILASGVAPAAAIAVSDGSRTLFSRRYGNAISSHLWQIGSIGKSMTAVLALQLAAGGTLDLHAPVTDYLPWFAVRSAFAPITLHDLLTHTAGLIAGAEIAPASHYDVIALAETEAAWEPGAHRWYSNVGYRVIGAALERLTGSPYPTLVQQRILDPLELRASVPAIVHDVRRLLPGGHVPFYDDRPWRPAHGLVPAPWIESADADGSPCCSIEDLARYARALWQDDERLADEPSLHTMKSALVRDERHGGAYGYGLVVDDDGFGHGGGMIGYTADLRVDTRTGLAAAACTNGIDGAAALTAGALAIARGETPASPEAAPVEPLVDDGSCPPEWRPCLGRYRSHNPWEPTFRVAAQAGRLVLGTDWLEQGSREPLAHLDGGRFRVGEWELSPERISFDTPVDGRIQRALLSGAPYFRAFTD